ncbi:MAG: zinc ribbon domain-containing protein [Verrucomicrobiota bacterium]
MDFSRGKAQSENSKLSTANFMDNCPNCGADLPKKARACPECGSDEKTGWSEEAYVGGLDLPDEEFNYNEFVDREFGGGKKIIPRGMHWFWWAVAVAVVGALIFLWFRF